MWYDSCDMLSCYPTKPNPIQPNQTKYGQTKCFKLELAPDIPKVCHNQTLAQEIYCFLLRFYIIFIVRCMYLIYCRRLFFSFNYFLLSLAFSSFFYELNYFLLLLFWIIYTGSLWHFTIQYNDLAAHQDPDSNPGQVPIQYIPSWNFPSQNVSSQNVPSQNICGQAE